MKENFRMKIFSTAAILCGLLCGQGQALLFAQQPAQSAADESNISTSPTQIQAPSAGQGRDQDLGREIQQQFATDAAFQSVKVNISNGVVVLEGPVASKRDKRRAVNSVKVLARDYRIDDRLTISAQAVEGASANTYTASNVAFESTMSNAGEVANEIMVAMANVPSLANSRVNVAVAGDSIELTGTVRTKAQREKIREIANSFAVHSHVVDKLRIVSGDDSK